MSLHANRPDDDEEEEPRRRRRRRRRRERARSRARERERERERETSAESEKFTRRPIGFETLIKVDDYTLYLHFHFLRALYTHLCIGESKNVNLFH